MFCLLRSILYVVYFLLGYDSFGFNALSAVYHVCSFNSVAQRVSCTCVRAGAASRITCLSQAPHRMGRAEQRFHAVVSELVIQQREVALPSRGRSIGWRRLETTYWKPRPAVISGVPFLARRKRWGKSPPLEIRNHARRGARSTHNQSFGVTGRFRCSRGRVAPSRRQLY